MSAISAGGAPPTSSASARAPGRRVAARDGRRRASLLSLAGWQLTLMRRRPAAKVLLGLLLGGYAALVGVAVFLYLTSSGDAADDIGGALLARLTFPVSISAAGDYTDFIGVILLSILAGTFVGNEYTYGTRRVAVMRGVGRGRALAAQVLALAIAALVIAAGMLLLGALVGLTLGPLLGGHPASMPPLGWAQLPAYAGAVALRLFVYSLVALFFATLGRSASAGTAGALGVLIVERVALPVFTFVAFLTLPGGGNGVRFITPQVNADAVEAAARQGPLVLRGPPLQFDIVLAAPPLAQALAALLLYCAALVGVSWLLVARRDVVE